jgi:dihydrofolate reductase
MAELTAIAAVADNGVIGDGHGLLWHIPEDFARFKQVTLGGALVMGRTTFESLGKPLPGRVNIVLTRSAVPPGSTASTAGGSPESGPVLPGSTAAWPPRSVPILPVPTVSTAARPFRSGPVLPVPAASTAASPPEPGAVHFVPTVAAALAALADHSDRRHWCIGGGEVYRLFWPFLTDLDITHVHQSPPGQVRFPAIDEAEWRETSRTPREGFDFVTYKRRDAGPSA